MSRRIYLSDISPWWTMERQEAALADVLPGAAVFRDVLDTRDRRAHQADRLVQRAAMLRPTTRKPKAEVVHVASLAVLAWAEDDLRAVLAALAARGAALVSVDDGPVSDVIEAWKAARKKSRLAGAAIRGAAVSAAKRRAAADEGAERIRERWGMPLSEWPTAVLLAEAGATRITVNARLGTREEAQRKYQAARKRAAARKAKTDG